MQTNMHRNTYMLALHESQRWIAIKAGLIEGKDFVMSQKITKPQLADTLTRMKAAVSEPDEAVDLETRIREMLCVARDDRDGRIAARNIAVTYRDLRKAEGEKAAENWLWKRVNEVWKGLRR